MSNWKIASVRLVNRLLKRFDLHISHSSDLSLEAAFERLARRPVEVNTIIDIGASDGRWSARVHRYYPDAFYFLVDANPVYEKPLDAFKRLYRKSDYLLAAAGNAEGSAQLYAADPLGGVVLQGVEGTFEVPMTTVDVQVHTRALKPPFLLKLDTHGFEVPILEGAASTLEETSVVIMETYNFDVAPGSLKFYEMCSHMETLGFRCIDVIEPMHRSRDDAFWQFDLLFIRADRSEFQTLTFA